MNTCSYSHKALKSRRRCTSFKEYSKELKGICEMKEKNNEDMKLRKNGKNNATSDPQTPPHPKIVKILNNYFTSTAENEPSKNVLFGADTKYLPILCVTMLWCMTCTKQYKSWQMKLQLEMTE